MILRDMLREIYYFKIKRMNPYTYRMDHYRRIGMNIGEKCIIFSDKLETSEPYLVTIGNGVMIAPDVRFITHDASACYYIPGASDLFGRINIGNNVFIGMGAIILPGVTIADNCIVGAGSVVTKSFLTPKVVISGNPAVQRCTLEELRAKNERYALNVWDQKDKKSYLLEHEDRFKGYTGSVK